MYGRQGASSGSAAYESGSISKRYLYHYTNEQGLKGIKETGIIRPSTDTKKDAVLGRGVYLTDRAPNTGKPGIVTNNYGPTGLRKLDK